jgi:hypothetical protein
MPALSIAYCIFKSVASFKCTYKNQLADAFEEVLPFNSQIDAQQPLLTRPGEVMGECRAKQVVPNWLASLMALLRSSPPAAT